MSLKGRSSPNLYRKLGQGLGTGGTKAWRLLQCVLVQETVVAYVCGGGGVGWMGVLVGHVEDKRGNSEIGEVFEVPGNKMQAMLKKNEIYTRSNRELLKVF